MFRSTLKMPCAHAAESEQVQRENAPTMTSTSTPQDPWTLPRAAYQASDPLTDCLVILTRFFQRPFSAQTLTAGLPLEQGRLTPELFTRAADRAGISARIMRRALKDPDGLALMGRTCAGLHLLQWAGMLADWEAGETVLWVAFLIGGGILIVLGQRLFDTSPVIAGILASVGAAAGAFPLFWLIVVPLAAAVVIALSVAIARQTPAAT